MKTLFALLTIVSAIVAVSHAGILSNDEPNNYTFGNCAATGLTLLQKTTVTANKRFGRVVTQDFTYNFTPVAPVTQVVCIRITDLKPKRGATVAPTPTLPLTAAGTITFTFTSQRSGAIKSIVEIYGSP